MNGIHFKDASTRDTLIFINTTVNKIPETITKKGGDILGVLTK